MAEKEKYDFFYWGCVILKHLANYSYRKIAEILNSEGYSTGKSTIKDTTDRFKNTGSPLTLKRGRKKESGIGKCDENCLINMILKKIL